MKQHKWAKEIHAWADGAEIEVRYGLWSDTDGFRWDKWQQTSMIINWELNDCEYRIKPQPKEPQYLYVYLDDRYEFAPIKIDNPLWQYIGKIKLEDDNGDA